MALKSTIFRMELTLSDMDREVYDQFPLTLARHPSETDERMMVRVLAFALEADERLTFGGGLSTEDEPALWRRSLDDRIERWIDVGLPEPKRLKQALGRSESVRVIAYGDAKLGPWWTRSVSALRDLGPKLEVLAIDDEALAGLASLADRGARLTVTIQDGAVWIADEAGAMVEVRPRLLDPFRPEL